MKFTDYKCLESLLIEGEELIAIESTEDYQKVNLKDNSTIQIKFLDKQFSVKVSYGTSYKSDGRTIGNPKTIKKQENAIKKLIPVLNKLSLENKSDIIKTIQRDAKEIYGKDLPDDLNVFDYFIPKTIYAVNTDNNKDKGKRIIAIMDPRYKLDPEHGAGIEFTNEKYSNGPIQSDYFY